MALDKFKAQKGYYRTPEKTIFMITLLGGGIGTISGMYAFRHKTKKLKFTIRTTYNFNFRNFYSYIFACKIWRIHKILDIKGKK